MDQGAYDKTYQLEKWYWWYVGRRYVFDKLLTKYFPGEPDKKIVDIGCGTGGNFPMLQKQGRVLGLDIEPRALEFCRRQGFTNVARMKGFYETGLPDNQVDLVTMFDVLEHFEDDVAGLKEFHRILKPSGYIFLSVPAFKILWSELDEYAHHYRRYKRTELERNLKRAGFEIVKSTYIFFFVFPLVFLYRIIGNFREKKFEPRFKYVKFPWFVDKLLLSLSKLEAWLLKYTHFPVGSSVVVLAKKINDVSTVSTN